MYLIFDTETTGLPRNFNAPITDTDNWPRCIQIAWQLHDEFGNLIENQDYIVKPEGFVIPYEAEKIHGISTAYAQEAGVAMEVAMQRFLEALSKAKYLVGQNLNFDLKIMGCEMIRSGADTKLLLDKPVLDTCTERSAEMLRLPGGKGGKFKLPNLSELHQFLFQEKFEEAHNATADVEATARCFYELVRQGHYSEKELGQQPNFLSAFREKNPGPIQAFGLKHINLKSRSQKIEDSNKQDTLLDSTTAEANRQLLSNYPYFHLHNHSQFSILQSTSELPKLVAMAAEHQMPAVALTDSGNMMGAFHFTNFIEKHNTGKEDSEKLTGIIGCELYIVENIENKDFKDKGQTLVLLAKNKNGYKNLARLSSIANTEGFYFHPRIDKKLLEANKEDLILLSGGMFGQISQLILNQGEKIALETFLYYKDLFQEDFYLEIDRHNVEEEARVNPVLIEWSREYGVKLIASNNTYYLKREDANAHDILLCLKEGEKIDTPIGKGRGFRFGFPNDSYYFRTQEEMKELFLDLPEAIINLSEIYKKIEHYPLASPVILPKFDIPQEFIDPQDEADGGKRGENAYLRHLTYEGAKKRYGEITPKITERLDFELNTIANTGYPGYFLIVQDFCNASRAMDVWVGPGRGSAAGSVVAYCIGITNVDPIKYDLLFERFLNPERVSMPDIDIDFDDRGRDKVIQYVIDKYGESQVAQIITYGTMAAKSSIRDTARVLDLPLNQSDKLAKLIPTNLKLNRIFGEDEKSLKGRLRPEEFDMVMQLRKIADRDDDESKVIKQAQILEGSVRNTGIHACGVIITPSDMRELIPVARAKDSNLWCTQFDNSVVESAGLLKMDFLGLRTLTIIKDAIKIIKEKKDIDIDVDQIPLDDEETYKLFQRGDTIGIFQYESPGMQKYMKELKPTVFADLIAMNALYRPGPMEYIPSFIRRKHGEEPITFDLPDMEENLSETYGITVYQEQVMLLSQKLAKFSKGEADILRKAMGKKQKDVLDKMKGKFIDQALALGHPEDKLQKIWKDWEAFAQYAFNKSHSTCYALLAYQTAYLKAHHPEAFMASCLSNNLSDLKELTKIINDCKRKRLEVLLPDVNESNLDFTVNAKGAIRFGLGGMKGVGEGAVLQIIEERKKNGPYKGLYDFVKRVDLRSVNKKTLESLALGGAFDGFEGEHRAMYFHEVDGRSVIENAIKFGNAYKSAIESSQASLFGEIQEDDIPEPTLPMVPEWPRIELLSREEEVNGLYLSSHPLDDYKQEMTRYCTHTLEDLENYKDMVDQEIIVGGIITKAEHGYTQKNDPMGRLTLKDYTDIYEFRLYKDSYLNNRALVQVNNIVTLKIKIEKGFSQKDGSVGDPRIVISEIKTMYDLLDKRSKELKIKIDAAYFDTALHNRLKDLLAQHPGSKKLSMVLSFPDNNNFPMKSRQTVDINKDILRELSGMEGLQYYFV